MNCSDARQLTHSWLDHTLDDADSVAFQAHLSRCPDCEALVDGWTVFLHDLNATSQWEEPERLLPAVMAALPTQDDGVDEDSWLEPSALFGLFFLCVVGLLRASGRVIGGLSGQIHRAYSPIWVTVSWVVVGLVFASTVVYMLLRKRVHAKFL